MVFNLPNQPAGAAPTYIFGRPIPCNNGFNVDETFHAALAAAIRHAVFWLLLSVTPG